jgi:hypothetical protein
LIESNAFGASAPEFQRYKADQTDVNENGERKFQCQERFTTHRAIFPILPNVADVHPRSSCLPEPGDSDNIPHHTWLMFGQGPYFFLLKS